LKPVSPRLEPYQPVMTLVSFLNRCVNRFKYQRSNISRVYGEGRNVKT